VAFLRPAGAPVSNGSSTCPGDQGAARARVRLVGVVGGVGGVGGVGRRWKSAMFSACFEDGGTRQRKHAADGVGVSDVVVGAQSSRS
jgi:hypothetical protein